MPNYDSSHPPPIPAIPAIPSIYVDPAFGSWTTSPESLTVPLCPTRSIDSFKHPRQNSHALPSPPSGSAESPPHSSPAFTFCIPGASSTGEWDQGIQAHLREMSGHGLQLGGEYLSADGTETESEWETDPGAHPHNHISPPQRKSAYSGSASSDPDMYSYRGVDASSGGGAAVLSAAQKGKGRADRAGGPGFLASPRTQTFSTASSASSVGYARARVSHSPTPPVPTLPAAFTGSSKPKPNLQVETTRDGEVDVGLSPALNGDESLIIAVVGSARCGKSEFTWKGMKAWVMNPEESVYDFDGIQGTSSSEYTLSMRLITASKRAQFVPERLSLLRTSLPSSPNLPRSHRNPLRPSPRLNDASAYKSLKSIARHSLSTHLPLLALTQAITPSRARESGHGLCRCRRSTAS